ncbi:hypothetical protein ACFFX0_15045 [Citricoccus parietis]|uniref:Uncharacterized protein n=1 Tax=Citricoccus parietis TaxID=592307 RepID=A0ABV5G0J2_9MICC
MIHRDCPCRVPARFQRPHGAAGPDHQPRGGVPRRRPVLPRHRRRTHRVAGHQPLR